MELFWKVIGAVLITVILALNIGSREKDLAVVLTVGVCCMGAAAAISFLRPVLEMLSQLESAVDLESGVLDLLMKGVGIAFVAELTELICADAGFGSLGKVAQLLGHCGILYLSVPMITNLLSLLQGILGNI